VKKKISLLTLGAALIARLDAFEGVVLIGPGEGHHAPAGH